jgi:hypothetical protein
MGFDENASVFVGIRIKLSVLLAQLNDLNEKVILDILNDGMIDDCNDYKATFLCGKILGGYELECFEDKTTDTDWKSYLIQKVDEANRLYQEKYDKHIQVNFHDEYILFSHDHLMTEDREIISTSRRHDRNGRINACSTKLDIQDLIQRHEKIKETYQGLVEGFEIVFMMIQSSG